MTSRSSEHDIGSSSSAEPANVGRQLHSDKTIVGAIDFGTTYSGYAYSLRNDFNKDPTKVQKVYSIVGNKLNRFRRAFRPVLFRAALSFFLLLCLF